MPEATGPIGTSPPRPFIGRAPKSTWSPLIPLGYPASIQALGGFAAPLLAATSFTMMALLLSSPLQSFARWPNAALTLFLIGGLAQIAAVQATMWARRYDTSPAELAAWYPEEVTDGTPSDWLRNVQIGHAELNERWANRTRLVYHAGIVMLLAGLVATVVPVGHITAARWVLILVGVAGLAGEVLWIVAASSFDRAGRRAGLHRIAVAILWAAAAAIAVTADSSGARLFVLVPSGVLVIDYLASALLPAVRHRGDARRTAVSLVAAIVAAIVTAQFLLVVASWSAWALAMASLVGGLGEAVRAAAVLRSGTDRSTAASVQ
jgi:hypothetical protein